MADSKEKQTIKYIADFLLSNRKVIKCNGKFAPVPKNHVMKVYRECRDKALPICSTR